MDHSTLCPTKTCLGVSSGRTISGSCDKKKKVTLSFESISGFLPNLSRQWALRVSQSWPFGIRGCSFWGSSGFGAFSSAQRLHSLSTEWLCGVTVLHWLRANPAAHMPYSLKPSSTEGFEDTGLGASTPWVLIDSLVLGLGGFTAMLSLGVHVFISKWSGSLDSSQVSFHSLILNTVYTKIRSSSFLIPRCYSNKYRLKYLMWIGSSLEELTLCKTDWPLKPLCDRQEAARHVYPPTTDWLWETQRGQVITKK